MAPMETSDVNLVENQDHGTMLPHEEKEVEEENLYDDLDCTINAPPGKRMKTTTSARNTTENSKDRLAVSSLVATETTTAATTTEEELKMLRDKVQRLGHENHQLKRNIGILFRTAKNEIKRKDGQILALQRQKE